MKHIFFAILALLISGWSLADQYSPYGNPYGNQYSNPYSDHYAARNDPYDSRNDPYSGRYYDKSPADNPFVDRQPDTVDSPARQQRSNRDKASYRLYIPGGER